MDGYVLVIDDEEPIREAIVDILDTVDIACLSASNGIQGLEQFQEHRALGGLVILDLSMPGMTGEETLTRLVALDPDVRVVLSSGYSQYEAADRYSSDNVCGFLQKPYRMAQLIDVVTSNLLAGS